MSHTQQNSGFWYSDHFDAEARAPAETDSRGSGRGSNMLREFGEKLRHAWMAHTLMRANSAVAAMTCGNHEDFGWKRSDMLVTLQHWREEIVVKHSMAD